MACRSRSRTNASPWTDPRMRQRSRWLLQSLAAVTCRWGLVSRTCYIDAGTALVLGHPSSQAARQMGSCLCHSSELSSETITSLISLRDTLLRNDMLYISIGQQKKLVKLYNKGILVNNYVSNTKQNPDL